MNDVNILLRSQGCLEEASKRLKAWIANPEESIHPDIEKAVFRYGMTEAGDQETWDAMWTRYLQEENSQKQRRLLYGLGFTREPWLLHRSLTCFQSVIASLRFLNFLSVICMQFSSLRCSQVHALSAEYESG